LRELPFSLTLPPFGLAFKMMTQMREEDLWNVDDEVDLEYHFEIR
jgi:hypothetical protein